MTPWTSRLLCPWDSPGKNAGVTSHSVFQGIFPTQRSNLGLLHCRQILCHLNHRKAVFKGIPTWAISRLFGLWSESCSVVSNSLRPCGLYSPWSSPGQNTEVGSLSLLQGIFPTPGSNPGLPHCRLSHKGNPKQLEWVVYPFFSGSSQSRNQTRAICIAGRFFTNWAIRKAHNFLLFFSPKSKEIKLQKGNMRFFLFPGFSVLSLSFSGIINTVFHWFYESIHIFFIF